MPQNKPSILKDFLTFCKRELNIQTLPKISLIKDKAFVEQNRSYGEYNPQTNAVRVFVTGRNLADICRSLAHELCHHRQNELDMIYDEAGNTGTEIENDANAMAGIIMREYGKKNVAIYDLDNQLNELKITVYPKQQGVDVDDPEGELETAPTTILPLDSLILNEPAAKMKSPESRKTLKSLMKALKDGETLSPIVVRKLGDRYQILDGHHRYFAMKALDIKNTKAIIVAPEDIKVTDQDYTLTEIGEGTKPFDWRFDEEDADGNYFYLFNTDKHKYAVGIANLEDGMYELSFNTVEHSSLDTNEGVMLRVLSTVVEITKDFIQRVHPEGMYFRPIKTGGPEDSRRGRIYAAYLKKNLPSDYSLMTTGDTFRVIKK
jgi:hypothetical protein